PSSGCWPVVPIRLLSGMVLLPGEALRRGEPIRTAVLSRERTNRARRAQFDRVASRSTPNRTTLSRETNQPRGEPDVGLRRGVTRTRQQPRTMAKDPARAGRPLEGRLR